MTRGADNPDLAIGQALKQARARLGMEIAEAEERTKIRARYIRAMEAEEWEVLPGSAYTRAFIRTYAQILGLDGEMLADHYRRAYDEPATTGISTEPLLERRRAIGERPPSRGPLIVALGIGLIVVLLLLGIFGGDDEADDGRKTLNGARKQGVDSEKRSRAGDKAGQSGEPKPVSIRLRADRATQVCVVGDQGALLDSQLIHPGADEFFDVSKHYRVDIEAGDLTISSAGESEVVETDEPTSFEVDESGIREISYAGPGCQ